ncbi:MAG: HAMP domain-containing histidine kinase [Chloroflexi bacterium]|nr:HAMP domain-containing histidine kinase [Chloroflexota bacterium]
MAADEPASAATPPAMESGDASLLRRTRIRLMALSGGITLVVLLVLGVVLYAALSASLAAAGEAQLEDRAQSLARSLTGDRGFRDRPQLGFRFGGDGAGTVAVLVRPDKSILRPSELELPEGLPDDDGVEAAEAGAWDTRTMTAGGTPVRVLSVPIETSEGTYVLQVIGDRTSEVQLLQTVLAVLLIGGLLALAAALAAGYAYAGRALVPIREAIDRRQAALRRQREFTADASHELRTPLTVIRASVADLRRNRDRPVAEVGTALEDIDAEATHLAALVDDLLLLARTDSGAVELERIPLDLADVAAAAAGGLGTVAAGRGVELLVDPLPTPVTGDPVRLRQVVTILVDNALAHGPRGSTVLVRVRPDAAGGLLQVYDQGPGIRPEDLPRVFDRFWRAPDAPPGGTGLGLAIAAWVVERHGGTITAANRPDGGSRFAVRLPAAAPTPANG